MNYQFQRQRTLTASMKKSLTEQDNIIRRIKFELQDKTKRLEQEQNNNALMRMEFSTKLDQQKAKTKAKEQEAKAKEQEALMWRDKYLELVQESRTQVVHSPNERAVD